jgi:hypothetical protein
MRVNDKEAALLELDHVSAARHFWYGARQDQTPSEVELHWQVAKVIAASDGALSARKRAALRGRMASTGAPHDMVERVMSWEMHEGIPSDLLDPVLLPAASRLEFGLRVIYDGLSVGFADGILAPDECSRARTVAAVLGVSASAVEMLISLCCDETLLRERRVDTLQGPAAAGRSEQLSPLACGEDP